MYNSLQNRVNQNFVASILQTSIYDTKLLTTVQDNMQEQQYLNWLEYID